MTLPTLDATDHADVPAFPGLIAAFAESSGDARLRPLPRTTRALANRALAAEAWEKLKPGEALTLAFPAGLAARALMLVKLPRKPRAEELRKAGSTIGKAADETGALIMAGALSDPGTLAEAVLLAGYRFSLKSEPPKPPGPVTLLLPEGGEAASALERARHVAEAVAFTRDLVNLPANLLTTTEFSQRLEGLRALGLEVEVLEEAELERIGMRALLAVGQGSACPSKVVVMRWAGAEGAPVALIGKGVVFDTGGISIKPAQGMEEMVMDMGGAAVVAGTLRLLAARKAKAHVVGLVGLVENMPDGKAQRPGDVVKSLKGDTIEVINTDAEGRLVLADVMWYAAERFAPRAMIDLATLTGAIIIALGHERAAVFGNDDALAEAFLKAAAEVGELAWRMPLGPEYDEALKSRVADVKNVGGRPAGACTAAAFLQRFVKSGIPWLHLDIAGVTFRDKDTALAPKGATGWGVRALDALIRSRFEG